MGLKSDALRQMKPHSYWMVLYVGLCQHNLLSNVIILNLQVTAFIITILVGFTIPSPMIIAQSDHKVTIIDHPPRGARPD